MLVSWHSGSAQSALPSQSSSSSLEQLSVTGAGASQVELPPSAQLRLPSPQALVQRATAPPQPGAAQSTSASQSLPVPSKHRWLPSETGCLAVQLVRAPAAHVSTPASQ